VIASCATLPDVTDHGRSTAPDSPAPSMTADDLVAATGGTLLRRSDRPIRGGAVDSRLVAPGALFVALPGERTDGHRFLADAVIAGAAALLVGRPPDPAAGEPSLRDLGDVPVVLGPDPLRGLQATAAAWRRRFSPLVVGITGSIAKTSTKEAVAAVLARRLVTLRTEGNQNNEVGLPLTVLGMGPEHQAAVLEMGMYTGGEIRDLAAIGRPVVGVVTAVQPVHLSRIGSLDAIEDAKAELVEALPPAAEGGVAVLNADDPRVRRMRSRTAARVVTYGFAMDAEVRAEAVGSAGLAGMGFRLRTPAGDRDVSIPALGALPVRHRAEVVRSGGVVIVDDTYNASPGSMRAALELLAGLPGRRIAVLGEMLELGELHDAGHREVGEAAAGLADLLVVVGGREGGGAVGIAQGALAAGMPSPRVLPVADAEDALVTLAGWLAPGDVVLVKASRGIALERVVDGLVSHVGGDAGRP
jgi:UDP-N-acetylmuramoyl-tripeptide--D-alanyl-D-alanine ligase